MMRTVAAMSYTEDEDGTDGRLEAAATEWGRRRPLADGSTDEDAWSATEIGSGVYPAARASLGVVAAPSDPEDPKPMHPLRPIMVSSRRGAAWAPLERVEVDPLGLAHDVRDNLREMANAKGSEILIYCTCRPIWVERAPFTHAIYQLAENAVAATPSSRPVLMAIRETNRGDLMWEIHSSGRDHGRVRLAEAVSERHGGALQVESASGRGTTFSVWLPGIHCFAPHVPTNRPNHLADGTPRRGRAARSASPRGSTG